ncbi:hypothetical protein [Rhizobium ruizarguesonis]|uniref:hypothetical protein n=1 Tax=Rhizobium ruizarguesonis TaxID=2081791 RepID=UPI00103176B9|nr:hypothetical protein [Rhizobium ruizarguesonis]TAT71036.1 hypothetical protein ELI52_36295 [Rhizobium ruizarguesonis]
MREANLRCALQVAAVVLAAFPHTAYSTSAQTPSILTQPQEDFRDVSSSAVAKDLQERGIDPFTDTRAGLRTGFISYDMVVSQSHNLNSDQKGVTDAAHALNAGLAYAQLTSMVEVRTSKPGARIRYKLVGGGFPTEAMARLTNASDDSLPIGIYEFWSERAGVETSAHLSLRIIKPKVTVDLEERDNQ